MGLIIFGSPHRPAFRRLGFLSHVFFFIAAVVFIAWLVGFGLARGEGSGAAGPLVPLVIRSEKPASKR